MEKKDPKPKGQAWSVIKRYTEAAMEHPWLVASVFVLGLLAEITSIVSPLFVSRLIDTLSTGSAAGVALSVLLGIIMMYGLVRLGGWLSSQLQNVTMMLLEMRTMERLDNTAFGTLIHHSHSFFVSHFAGSLTKRVSRYSSVFENIFDILVYNFFSTLLFTIGVIWVLATRSIYLALAVFIWSVLFIWIQYALVKWRQPLRVERTASQTKMIGVLSDAVSNHDTVNLFASWKYEKKNFAAAVANWRKKAIKAWNADNAISAIQNIFVIAIEIILLGGAAYLWQRGIVSVGDFVLIQVYVIGLINRIWGIGGSMRRLYDAFADAGEMVEILETPIGIQDVPDAKDLVVNGGSIAIQDARFAFGEKADLLSKFNLTIEAGEKVALVGPSGAGKSTITKLLLRLYDVTGGSIAIDGQNIAKVSQTSLREAISFVPQEPVLFHRSLMDNIRYGRLEATDEEVMEAAKKAHCHDFIAALPEGYATHVGERGVKLSGGERQRVAIARAILKDAPILILDEATSSLDSESEQLIQQALDVLMQGKTVLIIAHRLSTIMKMDRIVVIERGTVVDSGTHEDLVQKKGLYKKLWSIQAGSFTE